VLPASEMLAHWTAATPSDLHRIDTLALDHLAQAESARRHWLQHAPAYFLRQSPPERICSLTAEEIAQMQTALQAQPFRSALLGPVCFTWSDPSSQTHTLHIAPSGSSA
jgi:urocanate hydratase